MVARRRRRTLKSSASVKEEDWARLKGVKEVRLTRRVALSGKGVGDGGRTAIK